MQISLEGKLGLGLGLIAMAGAGAMEVAPDKLWLGWSLITTAAIGSVALGFQHFKSRFFIVLLAAGVLWFDGWFYSDVLDVATPASQPAPTPTAMLSSSPTPPNPKPRMVSTYQKMIFVCDKPKPEKGPSKKERQEKLDQYVDLMKKVFGYIVSAKATEDETTLDVILDKPIGNPVTSVVRQTWLIKRAGDQVYVTITNEYAGALSFMFQLAQPEASDPTMKTIIEQVEKFTGADSGKCKPI